MSKHESQGKIVSQSKSRAEAQSQGQRHLQVWLPADALDALDAEAETSGQSRACVLTRLLSFTGSLGEQAIPTARLEAWVAKARHMRAEGKSIAEICEALRMPPGEAWSIAGIRELFIYPAASETVKQIANLEPLPTEAGGECDAPTAETLSIRVSPQTLDRLDNLVAVLGSGSSREMAIELAVSELSRQTMGAKQQALATPEQKPESVTHNSLESKDLKALADTPHYREALAKEAKRLWEKGSTWTSIAQQWNEQGIPTFTKSGQWHGSNVSRLAMKY